MIYCLGLPALWLRPEKMPDLNATKADWPFSGATLFVNSMNLSPPASAS